MDHRYIPIILTLTCAYFLVQAQSEMFQITEKKSSNRYCGTLLADMLSIVCKGRYNTKFHKKSAYGSDSDEDYGYSQQQQNYDDTRLQFPFRSRPNAASLISGTFRRYTRGVYDECCKKPCHIDEMKTYCETSAPSA